MEWKISKKLYLLVDHRAFQWYRDFCANNSAIRIYKFIQKPGFSCCCRWRYSSGHSERRSIWQNFQCVVIVFRHSCIRRSNERNSSVEYTRSSRSSGKQNQRKKTYRTKEDNQHRHVTIEAYEGENQMVTENNSLGSFTLTNLPYGSRLIKRIYVIVFDIDNDGILNVKDNNIEKTIEIQHTLMNSK